MMNGDIVTLGARGEDQEDHRDSSRLVLGIVDKSGRLAEISANADELLGWGEGQRDTPLQDWVHAEDVPVVATALAWTPPIGPTTTVSARIHGRDGQWIRVQCLVSPLVARTPPRLAIAIQLPHDGIETADDRASRLEGHLWRIALEVQAAGLGGRPGRHGQWWAQPELAELSERQADILRRTVRGERVQEIARELVITESTVRNHLSAIYRKFGVHSQAALMLRLMPRAVDDDPSDPGLGE
jgi:DNA-binding CsgD family transcriptional regulator